MSETPANYHAHPDLRSLINDDAFAASFQSMARYRTALLEYAAPAGQGESVGVTTGEFAAVVEGPVTFTVRAYGGIPRVGTELYAAPQPAEQPPFEWPLLDAPALIGGVVVGRGCSSGHVVMIAKRKYQYEAEHSPEEHARRQKAFQDALAQIREGIAQQTAPSPNDCDLECGAYGSYCKCKAEAAAEQHPAPGVAGLVEALKFYADGDHLMFSDKDAWDTVTGEPPNLLCDEAGTATVEDGSIARHALAALASHHKQGGET